MTRIRAEELRISVVMQGVDDKEAALAAYAGGRGAVRDICEELREVCGVVGTVRAGLRGLVDW